MIERPDNQGETLSRRWFTEKLADSLYILKHAALISTPALATYGSLTYLGVPPLESVTATGVVYVTTVIERRLQLVPRGLDYVEDLLSH